MSHERNQEIINHLWSCAVMCEHCNTACLQEADVKMLTNCIRLNQDCADICRLAATLLARNSAHSHHLMQQCIEICEACAEECEKHSHMQHCLECAEKCRECAEECRNHHSVHA